MPPVLSTGGCDGAVVIIEKSLILCLSLSSELVAMAYGRVLLGQYSTTPVQATCRYILYDSYGRYNAL